MLAEAGTQRDLGGRARVLDVRKAG
jgi:hypothetical protein